MRLLALLALVPLAACGSGGGTANNTTATAAQQASEKEAAEDVTAAQSDAANVAQADAALDDLANEVGEPATGNAR